jgi:hypothetical protein
MNLQSTKAIVIALAIFCALASLPRAAAMKGDDFGSVVKMIEQFYNVRHQGIPFLARAGMKAATTAARIKGGTARRLAEAGSIKIAIFEDQEFDSAGRFTKFRSSINAALTETWMPLVQTLSPKEEEQTYIFLRDVGEKYYVLVITIERREATVVQVTLSPKNLALLMQDPNGMGKAITEDATLIDQE